MRRASAIGGRTGHWAVSSAVTGRRGWAAWWAACAVGLAFALVTHTVLEHPPTYDELLHVLSAEGLQRTGEPVIADGRYDRAVLYTRAVAAVGRVVDDELIAARLPAWFGALLLCAFVAAWTTRHAGAPAGAVAGTLLATHLWTVDLAVFARFYTLHALAVFTVFVCAYEATRRDRGWGRRAAWLAGSLLPFAIAWHLQVTTAIATGAVAAGLAAGLAADARLPGLRWMRARPWAAVALGAAAVVTGTALLFVSGMASTFGESPVWSAGDSGRVAFYAVALSREMPLLWPLVPLAALAVCLARPRLGWTLAVAAAAALAVHSLAAAKATRYAYYVLPWVCVLLGVAFTLAAAWLARELAARRPSLARHATAAASVLLFVPFALSVDGQRSLRLAAGVQNPAGVLSYGDESDWTAARPVLQPLADEAATVIVSNSMKALYYLGRYELELNAGLLPETESRTEFGRDPRTGRRVIGGAAALGTVLDRARTAPVLVVAENDRLGVAHGVLPEAVAKLDDACERVPVPAAAALTAWSCLPAPARPPRPPAVASTG